MCVCVCVSVMIAAAAAAAVDGGTSRLLYGGPNGQAGASGLGDWD